MVIAYLFGSTMTREEISELCIVSLANVLRIGRDRVKIDTKFSRLGLDSAMVVYVMMELEEKLDLELSTDDFYDHPTVDALSRYLAERRAARSAA
jgi:acyl carrier protein